MENISYVGLSHVVSLRRQMDVTANNIANMSTPGFKAQGILFSEYINDKSGPGDEGLRQVEDIGTYRDFSSGALTPTYNSFDFAIQGDGYFSIQGADGTQYTRDGSFSLDAQRQIVTRSGYPLLGDGGPIVVPEGVSQVNLNADGSIVTNQGPIGKVKIVSFDKPQELVSVGNNMFEAAAGAQEKPVEKPNLQQGMLESSNVNPIVEMNKMISVLRSYESAMRMLQTDHERSISMIQKLTRA